MGTLVLRDATAADGPAVRALIFEVLGEYGLAPDPDGTDADLADLEVHYLRRGGRFWVLADDAGAIHGSCALYPLGDRLVELRKMYLRRAARGSGWGRRLLERALHAARDDGHRRVQLETAGVLVEAIRLYERAGFRRIECVPHSSRCDQLWALDLEAK